MKARRVLIMLLAAQAICGIAIAHEGHHHDAMGTVEAIEEGQLRLKTSEDVTEEFLLTEATAYNRGNEPVTLGDVEVGERAVVMYEKKEGHNVVLEVKLAPKDAEPKTRGGRDR